MAYCCTSRGQIHESRRTSLDGPLGGTLNVVGRTYGGGIASTKFSVALDFPQADATLINPESQGGVNYARTQGKGHSAGGEIGT